MYRMTGQSPTPLARAQSARSPFVRLRELLDGVPPGKSAISLAVGEPQHPIPPFVGPVIAAHVEEFGRYPMNKGLDAFARAVGNGSAAATRSSARSIRRPKCWCSTAPARGLFLAALAAKNWVTPRAGRPAVLIPNPFYAAYSAGAIAADCEPVYLPATAASGFLPDLDALTTTASRARSPSISPRPPIRRAPSPTAPICQASPRWRGASVS